MIEKRYQIFISSTYNDLIEERQSVIKAILSLYHFPIGMEMFHADSEEQWVQIKNTIDVSDYYLLIMGRKCGTLILNEGISFTEKEYNYAISKNIPTLSFLISEKAKKESFGDETAKQQRALKKFRNKVKKLPCHFWDNADNLAMQVSTTLSLKFKEDNRQGWVPDSQIFNRKVSNIIIGEYTVLYFSAFTKSNQRLIISKLKIDDLGNATFYNNVKNEDIFSFEYSYTGICRDENNIIYIILKNKNSHERCFLSLIRSVGNLHRYIGIITATSSNGTPVSVKVVCFEDLLYKKGINIQELEKILLAKNTLFDDNSLIIEEDAKSLFFSEKILN